MGRLVYDGAVRFTMDDRTLAHVQVVVSDKLRRRESFAFTWPQSVEEGGGRVSVWVSGNSALAFTFDHRGPYRMNRLWLEELVRAANSPGGLHLVEEPLPHEPDGEAASAPAP